MSKFTPDGLPEIGGLHIADGNNVQTQTPLPPAKQDQQQQTMERQLIEDDSEDSSEELEVRVDPSGGIKKTRKKPTGVEEEEYDTHAKCEDFLAAPFSPKSTSGKSKKDKEPVPSSPVLLQYSFVAHALGRQLLRSEEVNKVYKPLKKSELKDLSGQRATLPRHYTFRSRSAPEFLANQRLWTRSLTRENRNLVDNPEYAEGIAEIDSARPQDAIEVISRFWEFTSPSRKRASAKTLESTKFVPKLFAAGAGKLLGEEHYVQQGGSIPTDTQGVGMAIKSEFPEFIERQEYAKTCNDILKKRGCSDVDVEFLVKLRESQELASKEGDKIMEGPPATQVEALDLALQRHQGRTKAIIDDYSTREITALLRDDLDNVKMFVDEIFQKQWKEKQSAFKDAVSKTHTQAIRLLAVEPRRNPASLILHQMALDLVNSGIPEFSSEAVFSTIPMTMSVDGGKEKEIASTNATAAEVARSVNKHLNQYMPYKFLYPGVSEAPDYLKKNFMLHEGDLVKKWIGYEKSQLQRELESTSEAIKAGSSEEDLPFLQEKQALCAKYIGLCSRLLPEATEEPMVRMTKDEMSQLVSLIDLNCQTKWYSQIQQQTQQAGQTL